MYVSDTVRVLLRRWYVVVPLVLLSLLGAGAVARTIPAVHEAGASILLLNSSQNEKTGPTNPYRTFDWSLGATGGVIAHVLSDDAIEEQLAATGFTGEYTVNVDTGMSAPVVSIVVHDTNDAIALATVDLLIETFRGELETRQRDTGVDPKSWIQMSVITQTAETTTDAGDQLRGFVGLLAGGLILSLGLTFLLDGFLARRHARGPQVDLMNRGAPVTVLATASSRTRPEGTASSSRSAQRANSPNVASALKAAGYDVVALPNGHDAQAASSNGSHRATTAGS